MATVKPAFYATTTWIHESHFAIEQQSATNHPPAFTHPATLGKKHCLAQRALPIIVMAIRWRMTFATGACLVELK